MYSILYIIGAIVVIIVCSVGRAVLGGHHGPKSWRNYRLVDRRLGRRWLAGQFMKGGGYGLIGDIIMGIIGAFVGGLLFGFLMPGSQRRAARQHRRRLHRRGGADHADRPVAGGFASIRATSHSVGVEDASRVAGERLVAR